MAFQVKKDGYIQIDPTFTPGYPYPAKYHNMGQLLTPYEGKKLGQNGDYAPPQDTLYYTPQNSTYPYPLDAYTKSTVYLPGAGSCYCNNHSHYYPCKNAQYPDYYVPGDYFAPDLEKNNFGKVKVQPFFNNYKTGHMPNFHLKEGVEKYSNNSSYYSSSSDSMNRRRLPTTVGPRLTNGNDFGKFDNYY